MNFQDLVAALPGEKPTGEDCLAQIQSRNLELMASYLAERAVQRVRQKATETSGLSESEQRNVNALKEEGDRRLVSLEGILKSVLKVSVVGIEQVATTLREQSVWLLTQYGKDLRVLAHLCAASIAANGIPGYADVVHLAVALMKAYPSQLHPQPDPDEPDDAWQRVAAASQLVSGDAVLALLSAASVVAAPRAGQHSLAEVAGPLRDDMPATDVSAATLGAAVAELGATQVTGVLNGFRQVDADLTTLAQLLQGQLQATRVSDAFRRVESRLSAVLAEDVATENAESPAPNRLAANPALPAPHGGLRSREDARRAIQEIVRFIEQVEPAHPAPLFLRRADRLLGMSFVDIIKDMAPGAVSDVERLAGTQS